MDTFSDTRTQRKMLAGPVIGTVLFATAQGIPMERITEATGLTREDLTQLDARLPERHMPVLWRLLAKTFPNRAIALEMAASVPFSFFGVLLHARRYAADLRAALLLNVRYSAFLSPSLQVELVEGELESRLHYYHPQDEQDDGHASELAAGLGARYDREVLAAQDALCHVELAHAPLGPLSAYRAFFRVPVVFGAERNALVYRSSALAEPLPAANAPALAFVEAHLELVGARARSAVDSELAPILDAVVCNSEQGEYAVDALARRLGTTTRSLQRRVGVHGTTPRALIDKVRAANARQLLTDSRLSISEVAFLLGYSGETAFRRAFRRWTNEPPSELRKTARS